MRYIYLFVDFLLIFSSVFIADKTYLGLSLFYFIWFFVVLRRKQFLKIELLSQILLFLFSPLLIRGVFTSVNVEYYNFYFQALGFVNIIFFIFEFIERYSKKEIILSSLFFLCIFCLGTMLFTVLTGGRGRFVFGPNVTYRVISFFYGFILLCYYDIKNKKISFSPILILSSGIFMLGMFFTGSRGALIVVLIYFILIFSLSIKQPKVLFISLLSFFAIIACAIYFWDYLEIYFHRLIYFNLDNNSESFRYDMWQDLATFRNSEYLYFGLTEENNVLSYYPHNIFLEVIFYFGIYAAFAFAFGFLFFIFSFMENIKINIPMLGIVFGSFLSGNLQYNYIVLSILSFSTVFTLRMLGNYIGK